MRRIIFAIIAIALIGLTSVPALASEFEDMDICLGKEVLARALCKDPLEVSYVAKVRDNIYLFSVFYAKQEARFVVGISNNKIRIQGKEFLTLTRTLSYEFDSTSKCGVVRFSSVECPTSEPIVCCSEKTVEEKLDEKFWDRPIPDLLEEDLRKALEVDAPPEGDAPAADGDTAKQ
ncbi:hypothetical protein [uncultured Pseudodesulfovibrio sp.]|uniref:hypothetical protein n=1 Tax=uncultured Pseudodesulfovibrio sp. TaxID=2035858 RepID=UPI0029C631DE|nr:hypothetical protein [uncultured Pseudodesulfovibrio sp.]